MLLRLAQSLEQMDLALEHLKLGDPANARFGLMLADNALEIALHRLAVDEQATFNQSAWGPGQEHPHAKKLPAPKARTSGRR